MSTCRSCGATIEWAITAKGHRIPLDPGDHDNGNIIVDNRGQATYVADRDRPLRRSHFASCPNAGRHRKRR